MKIGDLVTYKQRADLQKFPCPWHRMGIVVDTAVLRASFGEEMPPRCEVYWYGSENLVWWEEAQLELAR